MKKTISGILTALLLASTLLLAFDIQRAECVEPPAIEWSRTYGGASDDGYHEVELVKPSAGGYAIAGVTKSFGTGPSDAWLIKTDEEGNMEWNKTYGGVGNEWVLALIETSDGGYALLGHTNSFGAGNWDFWLIKTDAEGKMQWNRTYGGSGRDEGRAIVQTTDGGYAIAGLTNSFGAGGYDYWLVKTNSIGDIEWNRTYGGPDNDYAYSLILSDDGYAIAGQTGPHISSNAWLVKVDSSGNHQWNKTYGGTSSDLALSTVRTSDNGYAMTGYARSFGSGDQDFWLVKTDSSGNMEWLQSYGGINDDNSRYLIQTDDGGYAILGATKSKGAGDNDFWLVKTNSTGHIAWDQTYGGVDEDWGDSLVQTCSGEYVLAGWTKSFGSGNSDFWMIKLAPSKIPATIDIDPDTLNLRSWGNWITAYIEFPEGYDVADIDVSSILLNGTIPVCRCAPTAVGDYDSDGISDLMVKFFRLRVICFILCHINIAELLEEGCMTVPLTLTGKLSDGTLFEGSDAIRIIFKKPRWWSFSEFY
jgi:hypothetical protein